MALQFRATKRCWRRGLVWWIARATTSLPVPVSPVMSTVAPLGATVSIIWQSSRIGRLRPMTPGQSVALLELLAQVGVLGAQPALLERRLEDVQQLLELERLADEVGGAALDGVDGVLDSAVAGDDDADDPRITLEGGVEDLAAVDARQAQVGDEDVEGEPLELVEGLFAGGRFGDGEALLGQALGNDGPEGIFVVDQEEMDGFRQGGRPLTEASIF